MPKFIKRGKKMKLINPSELKKVIEEHGFSFSKGLGQNFLIDESILNKIIDKSGINESVGVLEIGPGAGTLTQALAEKAAKVIAVEIDGRLIPLLNHTLAEYDNVSIINEDILKVDLEGLIERDFRGLDVCVVPSTPLNILSSNIISDNSSV